MKTMYLWQEASISTRLDVYNNYILMARCRGDNIIFDFEEFDQIYHNHSFWSVAHKFGV